MSTRTYFAEWVLPIIHDPIRDGFVSIANGKISAIGKQSDFSGDLKMVNNLGHAG